MVAVDCPSCKAYGCRACGDLGYVLLDSDDERDERAEFEDLNPTADTAESIP